MFCVHESTRTIILTFSNGHMNYLCSVLDTCRLQVAVLFVGMLRRKTLVLDLDETLIHSHHDGVIRETVKPGTPPDFVLKVIILYLI